MTSTFLVRLIICVIIWFIFRDVIGAPNWGTWAVTIIVWYEFANQEWLKLLARRSV